ncbi:MAG TPA: hypothetical protein VFL59_04060, partial [Candidatus Nanopelagicales bacterium]|nr:hypothetical protein [Candidatus Nanopelagicales bacterium]
YAGDAVAVPLAAYRERYDRLREVERLLVEIGAHVRERAQEADLLRHGLAAVAAVSPEPAEAASLAAEAERLAHAEGLRDAAARAHESLRSDDDGSDALGLLASARRALDSEREHDAVLGGFADRLADVVAALDDLASDLASYADGVEADPARLEAVQERRAALAGLTRKYGATIDEVLDWAQDASRRLLELDGDDERLAALEDERRMLRADLGVLAAEVSGARSGAGALFGAAVTGELVALAMPHAEVSVALRSAEARDGLQLPDGGRSVAFGPSGVDEVEILLVPHAGAPARPIAKGASGGELSRVMLAVEVVLAGSDPVATLVFDEVDAGVGGKAAVEVGRRLARLGRSSQVLVVTHLPQVAAFADRHVVVEKSDDGRVTASQLRAVDDAERVRELARMLAGLEGSEHAAAHAQELLDLAAAERTDAPKPRARRRKGTP